jgi:hypothetical protein
MNLSVHSLDDIRQGFGGVALGHIRKMCCRMVSSYPCGHEPESSLVVRSERKYESSQIGTAVCKVELLKHLG